MSKLAAALALANQAAETGPDMNEVKKGGGARLLPEGWAFARFVEYIEFGNQPQEFNGQAKEPAPEAQIGFALYDTADRKYSNDDGSPYIIRPYSFALHQNEKARAHKLFVAMNWKRTAKNFPQMLGQDFLVYIGHYDKSKTDKTKVSRIDLDKIFPALDQMTSQPLPVPPAREEDVAIFLWDYPTKEAWDSLFREGTFDDGKSKNTLQEKCMCAANFEGSALQALLMGSGIAALPSAPAVAPAFPTPAAPVAPSFPAPATPQVGTGQSTAPNAGGTPAMTSPSKPVAPIVPVMPSFPTMPGSK